MRDRPTRRPSRTTGTFDLSNLLGRINAVLKEKAQDDESTLDLDSQIREEESELRSLTSGDGEEENLKGKGGGVDSGFETPGRTSPTPFESYTTKQAIITSTPQSTTTQFGISTPYPTRDTKASTNNESPAALSPSHIDDSLSLPTLDEAHFDRLGKRVTFAEMIMERTISSMGSSSYIAHQKIQYNINSITEQNQFSKNVRHSPPTSEILKEIARALMVLPVALMTNDELVDLSYDVPEINTSADSLPNDDFPIATNDERHDTEAAFSHAKIDSDNVKFTDGMDDDVENIAPDGPQTPQRPGAPQTPVTVIRIAGKHKDISHTPVRFGMSQDPKISMHVSDPFGSAASPKTPLSANEFVIRSPFNRSSGGTPKRGSPPLRESRTPVKPMAGLQPIDEDHEWKTDDGVTPKAPRTAAVQNLGQVGSNRSPSPMEHRFAWEESAPKAVMDEVMLEGDSDEMLGSRVMDDFSQLRRDMEDALKADNEDFPEMKSLLNETFQSLDTADLPDRPSSSLSIFSDDSVTSNDRSMLRKLGMIQTDDDDRLTEPEIHVEEFRDDEEEVEEEAAAQAATPHSNRRLGVPGSGSSIASPGTFFAKRSGTLGALGMTMDPEQRPFWTTPKKDRFGQLVDPFEADTPDDREEKNAPFGETPAGSRRVRQPLYESPSNAAMQYESFHAEFGPQEDGSYGHPPAGGFGPQPHKPQVLSETFGEGLKSVPSSSGLREQQRMEGEAIDPYDVLKARWAKLAPTSQTQVPKAKSRDSETHLKVEAESTYQALIDARSMLRETVESLLTDTKVEESASPARAVVRDGGELHSVSPPQRVRSPVQSPQRRTSPAPQPISKTPAKKAVGDSFPVFPASPSLKDWLNMILSPKDEEEQGDTETAAAPTAIQNVPHTSTIQSFQTTSRLNTQDIATSLQRPTLTLILPPKLHTTTRKPGSTTTTHQKQQHHLSIIFPQISYRTSSRRTLIIENPSPTPSIWKITPVGPAYVETVIASHSTGRRHPVEGSVFRFGTVLGRCEGGGSMTVAVSFCPVLAGVYRQVWHVRCNGCLVVVSVEGVAVSRAKKAQGGAGEGGGERERAGWILSLVKNFGREGDVAGTVMSSVATSTMTATVKRTTQQGPRPMVRRHEPYPVMTATIPSRAQRRLSGVGVGRQNRAPAHDTRIPRPTVPPPTVPPPTVASSSVSARIHQLAPPVREQRPYTSQKQQPYRPHRQPAPSQPSTTDTLTVTNPTGTPLPSNTLLFGTVTVGRASTQTLRVCNPHAKPIVVDLSVSAPFSVPARRVKVDARSYVVVPVAFAPLGCGGWEGEMVVRRSGEVVRVRCGGVGVAWGFGGVGRVGGGEGARRVGRERKEEAPEERRGRDVGVRGGRTEGGGGLQLGGGGGAVSKARWQF
ncbi:hypothetical protein HDV00_012737 [Rhizophlyctis rosea]|nr:hypothetical protein HDV00_012737 [Rhizophlyctis rosea]